MIDNMFCDYVEMHVWIDLLWTHCWIERYTSPLSWNTCENCDSSWLFCWFGKFEILLEFWNYFKFMLWFFDDYEWVILNLQHIESCKLETIYILSVDWLQSLNELCITDVWAMFSKFILDFCLRTNKVLSWGELISAKK